MKRKALTLLLCLSIALGLLTGCTTVGTNPTATPAPSPSEEPGAWIGPAASASQAPAEEWPVTLTDQAGREVTLEAPAEKIVSGYYISTSACIALGLKDKLVGVEKKLINIYDLAAPEFANLPNVGSAKEFDLEGCLALEPDLVILPKKLKDAAETISGYGIPVLLVNPESQEDLVDMLSLIGQATGTQERSAALSGTYSVSAEKLAGLCAGLTDADRPSVYLGGNGSILTTAPKDMYQADLIRLGGGANAGDTLDGDSWTEVSYEQILTMNPDVILLPSDASYTVDEVKGDPQLSSVTAVKDGAVYAMPNAFEAWDSPVPSCFLGSEWIMSVLHEDLFTLEDLRADAASFYQAFYGIEIDTSLISK